MSKINEIWRKLSTLGLSTEETHSHREIILLNKINVVAILLVFGFVPVEIYLNGFQLVPIELGSALIFSFGLFFTQRRWFTFAKYYGIILSTLLIFALTYLVGGYSNSEFVIFAILILPAILFNNKKHIFIMTILLVCSFYFLKYSYPYVQPLVKIPLTLKQKVQPIMNFMAMTLLFLGVYYLKLLNQSFEKQLSKKNSDLEEANEELICINEELEIQRNKIQSQKNIIEESHKEITDSINYAKRIQEAILPELNSINKTLTNSFVLYKPKDVVAGDFYWYEKLDNKIYIAAADCTGHGVPGAMMSVVCSNALTKTVLEDEFKNVGEILDRTREVVVQKLAKSGEVKDGMDISLACIDLENMKLEWAGANNPLYIIRNSEVLITKGNREPIGFTEKPTPFTQHSFDLQKNDNIYLFTDGYPDQFGGEKGKKLGYKKFRDKLIEVSNLDIIEQKTALDTYFIDWQGKEEQVDDVCLIGIKM